ncbi:hypothetical protein [Pelagibacterium montanilacus]|uniref:hypothetical protein n=1 Tax=Pelagibacterium montanilacus TaxID=2185280 RepID=UPI0013DEAF9B|nr:hypothetical protein [Pelagibacterium montanilacus]
MPIVILVLLAILIGTLGFWEALGALIGAAALVALFWIVLAATIVFAIIWGLRRLGR